MREFAFHGADGTRLVGWRNEGSGPRVLLCNGLAAPAQCWPGLLNPDCGYEVVSWHMRGFLGSDRPGRVEQAGLQVQSRDAVALLDHLGWTDAVFLGWSFGVNMAAEVALEEPGRMSGLVAVAGVPGGTFHALLGRNPLPAEVRKSLGITGTAVGESQAWGINLIAGRIPSATIVAEALIRAGFISGAASREDVAAMVQPYFGHDFGWYFKTARLLADHDPLDVSAIRVPVEVLVGRSDAVTDPRAVERFGLELPNAEVLVLPGTHFLPIEHPGEIIAALDRLQTRIAGA
jgi:pimeloyl-ACP methyl ester carboxylesterase